MGPRILESNHLLWFRYFTTQSRRLHVVRIELLHPMLHQSMTLQARRSFGQFGRGLDGILCDSDPQLRLLTPSQIKISYRAQTL